MASFLQNRLLGCISVALLIFLYGCSRPKEVPFSGRTMGTTYNIKVVATTFQKTTGLHAKIDDLLNDINQSMSVYIKDSEISRFNGLKTFGKKLAVSDDFLKVMTVSKKLHILSEGAWDGTVKPLMKLWGFTGKLKKPAVPPAQKIAAVMQKVGFDKIEIDQNGYLSKNKATLTLDLGSIAKGYGVDQVAALLRQKGFKSFIVEIGGEVYAAGTKANKKSWQAGINRPLVTAPLTDVYKIVPLKNQALATSGNYRQFFEIDGMRYAHIIEPATGYPVQNKVASVSVVASNCTLADGLATAILVMGTTKGLALLNRLEGVEGLIIEAQADGILSAHSSAGMRLTDM
jgi:FAD:protein FMN transferase